MKNRLLFIFILLACFYLPEAQAQCVKVTPYAQNFDGSNWVPQTSWLNSGSIPTCWNRLLSTGNSPNAQHTYGVISLQYTVRLFLINDCGDTTVITHSLTEVGIDEGSNTISVYPNPTQGYVQLEFGTTLTADIEVFNAAGMKVSEGKVQSGNDFQLDLQPLPAGSYEVRISTENYLWRRRILKL
ncbi:MAG: T9SS type A sorting domain-containing protein [Cryomorphaceae bacterium]|nr:T9SS type A sorting domain-containing protein [Cryomorphaceae bacterium]